MPDYRTKVNAISQKLRSEMPVVANYAYFDHAAVSPLPTRSHQAITHWLEQAHLSGDAHWMSWHQAVEQTRLACAELLNAATSEICLIPSTTFGINIVANGLKWQAGDSLIILANEFPSNYLPWKLLQNRGVEIRVAPVEPHGEVRLESIFSLIDDSTKLVAVSWIGYSTGFRLDLQPLVEYAHARDVRVFVDAIQGLGAFPLDTQKVPIDFLAADGHKWMLGPEGAGLLYIAERNLEAITPQMIGWNSVVGAADFGNNNSTLKSSASRFEGGTANTVGVIGFGASLRTLLDCGCHRSDSGFSETILERSIRAQTRLLEIGALVDREYAVENYSGIVSFTFPNSDSVAIRSKCISQNVILSVRHGKLRIATHAYNDDSDIDRLIDALQNSLRQLATS